jgi:hypothetical protein
MTPIHNLYVITRDHPDSRLKELAALLFAMRKDEHGRQNPVVEPPPAA